MKTLESAKIHYENLEYIGEGSSGTIYKALRRGMKQHGGHIVALKILKSKKAFQELVHEYESLLQIESPYILKIFSLEETSLGPALIMEYIEGISLYEFWKQGLASKACLQNILLQLQSALRDLQARNLFHGDLNLKNILLSSRGRVKLIDFGNSYEKNQGQKATLPFAAPECIAGEPKGILSDLYSLAKIEEFLSNGQSHLFAKNLDSSPEARDFLAEKEIGSTEDLEQKISIYIGEKANHATQQILKRPSATLFHWKKCCLFLACFILPNQFAISESSLLSPTSTIEIRSKNWLEISVNGKYVGFTPVKIMTREKSIKIQWRNASESGQIEYLPQQKQSVLTEDELFLH